MKHISEDVKIRVGIRKGDIQMDELSCILDGYEKGWIIKDGYLVVTPDMLSYVIKLYKILYKSMMDTVSDNAFDAYTNLSDCSADLRFMAEFFENVYYECSKREENKYIAQMKKEDNAH